MKTLSKWLDAVFGPAELTARQSLVALEKSFNAATKIPDGAERVLAMKSIAYVADDALLLGKFRPSFINNAARATLATLAIAGMATAMVTPFSAVAAGVVAVLCAGAGVALLRPLATLVRLAKVAAAADRESDGQRFGVTPQEAASVPGYDGLARKHPDFGAAFSKAVNAIKPLPMKSRARVLQLQRGL